MAFAVPDSSPLARETPHNGPAVLAVHGFIPARAGSNAAGNIERFASGRNRTNRTPWYIRPESMFRTKSGVAS